MACVVSPEVVESTASKINAQKLLLQDSVSYNSCEQPARNDPKDVKTKQRCYCQKGSIYEHAVYFTSLAAASYVGVLVRIYSSELANWDGVALFPSLYPQIVGTIIMGFMSSHQQVLTSKHVFLYQAIATGLCGSITTFSSWNSEAISSLLQTEQEPPNNIERVLAWSTTLLLGLGMSSAALTVGRHLAIPSPWSDAKLQGKHLSSSKSTCGCCDAGCVEGGVFLCVWLVATVLVGVVPYVLGRRDLVFICILASLGTYLRWHLSPLNSVFSNFKLGTFLVNVGGSWLLGGVICAEGIYGNNPLLHDLLIGLGTGFCGCLTTVSTFAVELSTLSVRDSYLYAFTSIALAQVGLVLIRGTVQWTHTLQ